MKTIVQGALLALAPCWAAGPPLLFEQNQGQMDASVRYLARSRGAAVFFQDRAIVASFHSGSPVTWTFAGANPQSRWEGLQESPLRVDSFTGGPSRWRRDIRTFEKVIRKNVYPDIDAVAYARGRDIEFDFVVRPGGDPRRLRIRIAGGTLQIGQNGDLMVETAAGRLVHRRPLSYQSESDGTRREVASRFKLAGPREALIETSAYDRTRELVIDPVVTAISYFGGESDEEALGAAAGYLCGSTASAELPSAGSTARGLDVFLYPGVLGANRVIYYGGSGDDRPTVFAATSGFALIGGETTSRDLPTGVSEGFDGRLYPREGLRTEFRGPGPESFLAMIPLRGTSPELPMVSTYWGEPGERLTAVAAEQTFLRAMGRLAVAVEKPAGANGGSDAALLLLDEYLRPTVRRDWGGSGDDRITQLEFALGSLFSGGITTSSDLVPGSSVKGESDAVVARWGWNRLDLDRAMLLGGTGREDVRALAVDGGAVWIAGSTSSADLPTVRAWQPGYGGGPADGFAALLDVRLSAIRRLSYFGGSGADEITAFLAQSVSLPSGLLESTPPLLAGTTSSADLPVSTGADQPRFGGGRTDGFYFRVSEEGRPDIASYLGGAGDERVAGATRLLTQRPFSIAGTTTGELDSELPPGRSYRGGREIFIAGMDLPSPWLSTQVAGNGLVTPFSPAPDLSGTLETEMVIRSADPGLLLVSDSDRSQPGATITTRFAGASVYLWGKADSGSTELIITRAGYPERRVAVRLAPAGMALRPDLLLYAANPQVQLQVQPAAIDPETRLPLRFQAFPQGQPAPAVRLESSDETVASVLEGSTVRVHKAGSGEFRVIQPPGFFEPAPTPFQVADSRLRFNCPAFGKDLRTSITLPFDGPAPSRVVLEVDPDGPVLLAATQNGPTATRLAGAPVPGATIWLETLADSGSATIRVTGVGMEPGEFTCPVYPSAVGFVGTDLALVGQDLTKTSRAEAESAVVVAPLVVTRLAGRRDLRANYLRPGISPAVLRLDGPVTAEPVTLGPGTAGVPMRFKPQSSGKSRVSLRAEGFGVDLERGAFLLDVRPVSPVEVSTSPVGQYMESSVAVTAPAQNVRVTLRAAPGRFLLRYPVGAPPSAEVSFDIPGSNTASVGLVALGETGEADLEVRWENATGSGEITGKVAVLPTIAGLLEDNRNDLTFHAWSAARVVGVTGYIDRGGVYVPQTPSPAFFERVRLSASRPETVAIALAVRPPDSNSDRPSGFALIPRQTGLTELTLESDLPVLPGARQLRVRVTAPGVEIARTTVGAFLSGPISVIASGAAGAREGQALRVRMTSSNPSQLLLSLLPQTPGAESIDVTIPQGATEARFYLHGVTSGLSEIVAVPDGGATTKHPIAVAPTGVGFFHQIPPLIEPAAGVAGDLAVELLILDPTTLRPLPAESSRGQFLRAGIGTLRIEADADPPGGVTVSSPVTLDSGTVSARLRYSTVSAGATNIILRQPPGFTAPSGGQDRVVVRVRGRSFFISETPPVGRDTLATLRISASEAISSPLTITSLSPGKLLVSAADNAAATNQITVTAQGSLVDIYLHGLSGDGTAQISVTGEGYSPLTVDIPMAPTAIELSDSAPRLVVGQTVRLTAQPWLTLPSGRRQPARVRPGANVRIGLRADPAGVVDAPADVPLGGAFDLTGRTAGETRLTLAPPAGFVTSSPAATVRVSSPRFFLPDTPVQIGKDLMTSVNVGVDAPSGAPITLTSSNPGLLLVSRDANSPASAAVTSDGRPTTSFMLHGLGASGTVQVTVSSPGLAGSQFPVALGPSGFVLEGDLSRREVPVGATFRLAPVARALDPVSLEPRFGSQTLRPDKPVSVSVQATDGALVRISPARIDFPAGPQPTFEITALAPGRVTVTLRTPEGFQTPSQAQSVTLDITDAFFSFTPPRVGYNLQSAASLELTPAPSSAVPVTIRSLNPERMLVSGTTGVVGSQEVVVTASAAVQPRFFLHGLAGSGVARLAVSAPGYRSFELDIPLLPSGFVFESQSTVASASSPWRVGVVLAPLSALTRLPFLPGPGVAYALRPGTGPLTVQFEVTDSGTGLKLAPLLWDSGVSRRVPVAVWERPGNATIRVVQAEGYSEPSSNGTIAVSVQ